MSFIKNLFKENIAIPWVIVFLLVNIIARGTGGHNEGARLGTLRAMSEQGSFVINKYTWGDDWSINDKGEKFANKAPGPMFIGFPIYFIIDSLFKNHKKSTIDKDGHNTTRLRATPRALFSIIMQVIPFALFILFLGKQFLMLGFPKPSIHFSLLALLFGNTSSIFMNTYFGHGMSAAFAVALVFYLLKRNYKLVGLFFGLTLLSEYAAALLFFPLILAILMHKECPKKWIKDLIIGGFIPGLFWCWYHISSFGSPFQTAIQHENPIFFETQDHSQLIFGMFDIPRINILFELLIGTSRGLLFTQPWILLLLIITPFYLSKMESKEQKSVAVFCWSSLTIMLLMNSSFNGWHGGMTAGPRYLSIVLAPFAILIPLLWSKFNKKILSALILFLLVSIEFRGRVFATSIHAPQDVALWPYQWDIIINQSKHLFRYILFYILFGIAYWFAIKKDIKDSSLIS